MYHCPLVRRARLILYKALALSGLALAATLLSAPAAHAGHWEFTCAGDGNNTITYAYPGMPPKFTNWPVPTAPQVGSFSLVPFGDGSDYANSSVTTINVTVTATWKADGGEGDTVPPNVWLCESASADWSYGQSGSADDGFGDAAVPRSVSPYGAVSVTATSNSGPMVPQPPPHWTNYTVNGGSVTLPKRTLKAEADYPNMYGDYGGNCYTNIDSYNVTVHPTPYNFHQTSGRDDLDGTISFTYAWLSTSGHITDLNSCYLHERVSYNGGNPFYPPLPFLIPAPGTPNPTVAPGTFQNGIAMTSTTTNGDTHYEWATSKNYNDFTSLTVSAAQRYEFDDLGTEYSNVLVPGPDSTQTITRTIYPVGTPPPDWWYKVTKNGVFSLNKVESHP